MGNLRDKLYDAINEHGLDYDKLIAIDMELHNEIIKQQMAMMKGAK